MLKALMPRALAAQVLVLLAAALCVSAATLVSFAAYTARGQMTDAIESENVQAVRLVTSQLSQSYSRMEISGENDGLHSDMTVVWPNMPPYFRAELLDPAAEASAMSATLFRLDPETGAFVTSISTEVDQVGDRGLGDPLAESDVAAALRNGQAIHRTSAADGMTFAAFYQPILDETGQTIGALRMGRDIAPFLLEFRRGLLLDVAISITVALLLLALCTWIMSHTMRPLGVANAAIADLSNGVLDQPLQYLDRTDEIGAIFKGLAVLQASMKQAEELQAADLERSKLMEAKKYEQDIVVAALSEGLARLGSLDLTRQIENAPDAPFPEDYEDLRTSYNMLVDNLSDSVEAIRTVAAEVNADAREMASSSVDLSTRTENQAATLEQSAAALEELSASVQSTAENAADAEASTRENRSVAKRTGEVVDEAIAAMAAIEASSQKITQIISVIDDIAFQTNLLALNAGVEAARAGEAGRGFAVVASEVRALAQHSSASAQEIKTLIAASSDQVDSGSTLVRRVGGSINDIVQRVDQVASLVSDIAVSAKEQSIGVSEINSGVRDLDAATQRNAAMAEEASAASEGLTNAADRLADHLARFQLNQSDTASNWAAAATRQPPAKTEVAQAAEAFGTPPPQMAAHGLGLQSPSDVFRDF